MSVVFYGSFVLCMLACMVCAISPPVPVIPLAFQARVSATLVQGKDSWRGPGLFALDVEKGFARTDIVLYGNKHPLITHIHNLDRYDNGFHYTIDNHNHKCVATSVKGDLANPFGWIESASFEGEEEYLGSKVQTWTYTEGRNHHKIAVKKGTNEPVMMSTTININGTESELLMVVREWIVQSPPQWMRYIPSTCHDGPVGDVNGVVYFANNNWNCADINCDTTVPAGSGQESYACAEFVARCLVYGGFIPNIGTYDPQGSYGSYSINGQTYSLIWVSSLSDALGVLGFTKLGAAYSSVNAGVATLGDGGDGPWSHAVIGVGPQTIDAHNNARLQIPVSDDLINGVDAAWGLPGSPSTSSTGSSSTYFSVHAEIFQQHKLGGGQGHLSTNDRVVKNDDNEFSLVEEKSAQKFKL